MYFLDVLANNEILSSKFVLLCLAKKATFRLSGNVNKYNCRIWALDIWRAFVELQWDSAEVRTPLPRLCIWMCRGSLYGHGGLEISTRWSPTQIPPGITKFLGDQLPERCVGQARPIPWPSSSPDFTSFSGGLSRTVFTFHCASNIFSNQESHRWLWIRYTGFDRSLNTGWISAVLLEMHIQSTCDRYMVLASTKWFNWVLKYKLDWEI
jgi:hypothetical protein